jgi:hypothetical protein
VEEKELFLPQAEERGRGWGMVLLKGWGDWARELFAAVQAALPAVLPRR